MKIGAGRDSSAGGRRTWVRAAAGVMAALVALVGDAGAQEAIYARIDIHQIGSRGLARLQADTAFQWWVELDDRLLVRGEEKAIAVAAGGRKIQRLGPPEASATLFLAAAMHPRVDVAAGEGVRVLARGGRWAVVEAPASWATQDEGRDHLTILPFEGNRVLARQAANAEPHLALRGGLGAPPVDSIDGARWFADVETLASWNRYSRGSEIDQARDWLVARFGELPGLAVSTESFQFGATTAHNVFARLEGASFPDDWYIIGGHYDSTSQATGTAAPGAEDNATGCAGVLELARVITANPPGPTILFVCYSGEEQGLFGSADHASDLVASGDDARVRAMINMDMIGYSGDADLDALLETSAAHQTLIDTLAAAAAEHTTLRIVSSLSPFGSDHVPYLDAGMPAILTIENDWDSYPHYHRTTDLPTNVTVEMGRQVLRMNLAGLWAMVGAECVDADGDGYGDPGSLQCSFPEADCDDGNAAVNPGASEIPDNGLDDDCDPSTPSGCQARP